MSVERPQTLRQEAANLARTIGSVADQRESEIRTVWKGNFEMFDKWAERMDYHPLVARQRVEVTQRSELMEAADSTNFGIAIDQRANSFLKDIVLRPEGESTERYNPGIRERQEGRARGERELLLQVLRESSERLGRRQNMQDRVILHGTQIAIGGTALGIAASGALLARLLTK